MSVFCTQVAGVPPVKDSSTKRFVPVESLSENFIVAKLNRPPPPAVALGIGIMARVLIVEDEPTDRVIFGTLVERAGHEVYLASNAVQALNIHGGRRIDVVITDLHMPHIDGIELIRALRELLPDAAIIAVSGSGPDLLASSCPETLIFEQCEGGREVGQGRSAADVHSDTSEGPGTGVVHADLIA